MKSDPQLELNRLVPQAPDVDPDSHVYSPKWVDATAQSLLDAAPDAMLVVNQAGEIVVANVQAERLFGRSREELIGLAVESLIPAKIRAQHPQHRTKFFNDPRTRPMGLGLHLSGLRKDGTEVPVEISLSQITNEAGTFVVSAIRDATDRRRAEGLKMLDAVLRETRESEERFSLIADTSPALIWMSGTDKSYTYFNKPWLDFIGRSLEDEVENSDWEERVHPEDLARCLDTYAQAFDHREEFRMEYRLRRHDGEYRWVFDIGVPRFNQDRCFVGYIGIGVDVTERKLAEKELGVANERLSLAMQAGRVGGWEWDLKSDSSLRFGETYALLGITPGTQRGSVQEFWDVVHPEDRVRFHDVLENAKQSHSEFNHEFRVVWPDGSIHWLRSHGRYSYGMTAQPERLLGISIEITERKLAEEAQLRHSAIVQSCDDAIISMDLQGTITDWNAAAESIYGYSKEESVGQDVEFIIPPELRTRETEILKRLQSGESTRHFETVHVRKDGSRVSVSLTLSPIRDSAGCIVGASEITRDISEAKRAQEQLQKSYAEVRELKEKLQAESDYLQEEVRVIGRYEEIVGQSEALKQVLWKVEQVATTDSVVLITGESGTGKELVARAVHDRSKRRDRVLVKVDCASLPATLIESELFGREKGAYTGALTRQVGRIETAEGSTLFLDEIGELGVELQAKLLRVVQEGNFERLGSSKTTHVNVRLIAATHRNLAERVKNETFREDLFYRLNVFPIHVPPLRERVDDIPLLATAFLREFEKKMGKEPCRVSSKMMDELKRYPWPGNIRELRNVIERAVIITSGDKLNLQMPRASNVVSIRTLKEAEYQQIVAALEKTGWRIKGSDGAAELLGMNPSTLYTTMRRLHIPNRHEKGGMKS